MTYNDVWDEDDWLPPPVYTIEHGSLGALYECRGQVFPDWNPLSVEIGEPRLLAGDKLLYLGLGRFLHLRENIKIYILDCSYNKRLFSRAFKLLSPGEDESA